MNNENIRFELFQKYLNQEDNLNDINKVLCSLKRKKINSLREDDLIQKIELQMENISFLKNENKKGLQTIANLKKEISKHENNINILSGNAHALNGRIHTLKKELDESNTKLRKEESNKLNLLSKLEGQEKSYKILYNELKNNK